MRPWLTDPAATPVNVRYPTNDMLDEVELRPQSILCGAVVVPMKQIEFNIIEAKKDWISKLIRSD